MNHNPHNFQIGETVILDEKYNNSCDVIIKALTPNQLYANVYQAEEHDHQSFTVMTNRLTPKSKIGIKLDGEWIAEFKEITSSLSEGIDGIVNMTKVLLQSLPTREEKMSEVTDKLISDVLAEHLKRRPTESDFKDCTLYFNRERLNQQEFCHKGVHLGTIYMTFVDGGHTYQFKSAFGSCTCNKNESCPDCCGS